MNIQRIGQVMETYRQTSTKPAASVKKSKESRDEINISPEARLYDYARKAGVSVPDIREEKVADIRKQLESGNYTVSAAAVAMKMLD